MPAMPDADLESLSREELEAELRRLRVQSASLAQMFEQAPSFIALLSGPEHRFTLTNAAYQRAVDGRDVTGRTVAEALPDAAARSRSAISTSSISPSPTRGAR